MKPIRYSMELIAGKWSVFVNGQVVAQNISSEKHALREAVKQVTAEHNRQVNELTDVVNKRIQSREYNPSWITQLFK